MRSFDDELAHLANLIARMGGIAESQLAAALQALAQRDSDLAARIVANDAAVDALDKEVYAFAVRLLALRQPVAQDLRHVVGALKISGDIERMADYAANLAKRVLVLNAQPPVGPTGALLRIGRVVQEMTKDVFDAYVERDADKAMAVRARDDEVDGMYTGLTRELITYMIEDARTINACTHLLFMAKNLERFGDHATNVAEIIHYVVHGATPSEGRPKADRTTEADGEGE